MTKKMRTHSTEFKAEAVKKIADNHGNISATAKLIVNSPEFIGGRFT